MDDDQFLEAYLNTLEVSEGAEGGDTVTGMATRPYGVKDLLGVNEEDYKDNPRGLAKAVASKNIDELKRMGIDWDNLPASMKFNALDIQFNMGSLNKKAPKYFKAVKAGNYDTAIKESLDAIGAYDPKRKGERPTKGIALRRAMLYNMVAKEMGYPTITSVEAINQDNPQKSAKVTYNRSEGAAIPVTYETLSLHSTTKPGTVTVSETMGMTAQPVTDDVADDFSEPLPVTPEPKPEPPAVPTPQPKPVTPETKTQTDAAFTLDYEGELPDIGDDVPMPDLPATDVAPDTTDAIPPAMVDVPEEKNIFERAYDYMFGEDTPEEIQQREQTRQRLLQSLEMNEGGVVQSQMDAMLSPDDMMMPQQPPTPEAIAEGKQAAKEIFFESFPGIGEAAAVGRVKKELKEEDYIGAGIETAAGLVGMLPLAGDIVGKSISRTAKALRKEDAELADKLLKDETTFKGWKKENKVSQEQKRVPEVQEAAQALTEGKITSKDYRHIVKGNQPIRPITSDNFPDLPTKAEIVGALKATDPRKLDTGVIGLNKSIKDGTRVGSRLDIPAYEKYDKWIVSLHDGTKRGGNAIGYGQTAVLTDVEFITSAKGGVGIAKGKPKTTIARIHGDYQNAEPENVFEAAKQLIDDPEWTQVGMNPFRHSYFYDKATGNPVTRADEVIQVGPLVLARGVKKPTLSEMKELFGGTKVVKDGKVTYKGAVRTEDGKIRTFNEGGMAMERQMEMFEDGGLMDEGGTVDPVSGNDVPPGSTQEEVRDDIPAQLSEGEFVFPADVVRYIGLEKLMQMRQEAKMGLKRMEDMGQMGNSEEAVMPDDLPFTLDDLEMEDEPMEFQVGGLVPNPYGTYQQASQFASYGQQPYQAPTIPTGQPMQQQPVQATGFQTLPVQQVPTAPSTVPTFEQLMPTTTGKYDELREYVNEDTGQSMTIPFVDGKPIYPIPQGFTPKPTEQVEAAVPETTTVPTARVAQVSGDDDDRDDGLGPGGGRVGMGGFSDGTGRKQNATIMGVSFDMGEGFIGGAMGAGATALSLATGKPIPAEAKATFTYDNATYTVSGNEYNELKKAGYTGDLADKIVASLKTESGVRRGTIEYNKETGTFKDKKSGETFQDRDDDNDGIGDILNKSGQSVYNKYNVEDLISGKQKMNQSEKAIASAYNDAQFEAFDFGDDNNDDGGGSQSSGGGTTKSSGADWSAGSDFSASERESLGPGSYNKGGLTNKPKAKKMKQGGMASKK